MIQRSKGGYEIACEDCGTVDTIDSPEFSDVIKHIRDEGWQARKWGTKWVHHCPECMKTAYKD